jgi:hypothetical protein
VSKVYICKVFGSQLPYVFCSNCGARVLNLLPSVRVPQHEKIYIVENNLWRASNFMRSVLLLPSLQHLTKPNMCRQKYTETRIQTTHSSCENCSTVSAAINNFYLKTGTGEGAENLLNQLGPLALVINIFLLPPVLFFEYTPRHLNLETGL